jgi:sodium transport system permease protein
MKKEFTRFFKDKRLVMMLLLPGILIYAIYSLIGTFLVDKIAGVDKNHISHVYYLDETNLSFGEGLSLLQSDTFVLHVAENEDIATLQEKVQKKEIDLFIHFQHEPGMPKPVVSFYYNTSSTHSAMCMELVKELFITGSLPFTFSYVDKATQEDMTAKIFSSVAPMLLLMFLFSGCISIAPESIAGEKERGTLGAMLVTPVKRSHIALGKIFSLSCISLLSGICSFLGLVFSLPNLAGGALNLSVNAYTIADYSMMLVVILTSLLLMVAMVSVVSAYSKSTKEATNMVGPLSIVMMLLGLSTMLTGEGLGPLWAYCIPLYNSARTLFDLFSFHLSPLRVILTGCTNLLFSALLTLCLAKMFDSEKVVFHS